MYGSILGKWHSTCSRAASLHEFFNSDHCQYFYICANSMTILFHMHQHRVAPLTPTTTGFRMLRAVKEWSLFCHSALQDPVKTWRKLPMPTADSGIWSLLTNPTHCILTNPLPVILSVLEPVVSSAGATFMLLTLNISLEPSSANHPSNSLTMVHLRALLSTLS